MTQIRQKLRCAIYTRKSSDEGLSMDFNTLDAQREAAESYILSQKHEGWTIIPTIYEDGGFSGGNMKRPGFQKLLSDVERGFVDMIVVYKIDRLTRSLTDFSKMIEIFEKHNVSFVSVTQQFNTSTSMGRLTLNMLLSFAQFEREVGSERVRDKIAASKKKGMFMGGLPSLGYNINNRQLVINKNEAKLVKLIYDYYIKTHSYRKTADYINASGYTTKKWTSKSGKLHGGKPFDFSNIYRILNNVVYIGKITHKDQEYDGLHQPIISQDIWDKVQEIKKIPPQKRTLAMDGKILPMLRGKIFCGCCRMPMTTTTTKKKNILYTYYVSTNVFKNGYEKCELGSIPANKIEGLVVGKIKELLKAPEVFFQAYKEVKLLNKNIDEKLFYNRLKRMDDIWDYLQPAEINQIIQAMLEKVIIYDNRIEIRVNVKGIHSKLKEFK
ncbi:MAG: recombinase family protein [Alphaproteobacteria bacterium]